MSEQNDTLNYKIAYLSRLHKRKIDQDTLKFGLTTEQGRLILYLNSCAGNPVYLKDLENKFKLRKSSLNSLVNNLEKNGCVIRITDKSDNRLKEIRLTELGKEKVNMLDKSFEDNEKHTRQVLSDSEANILNDILDKLIANINKN